MAVQFKYTPPKIDARLALAAAGAVAVDAAATVLLKASDALVPVEEGILLASGRVETEGLHASVTYGRDDDGTEHHAPSNQYVVPQHEDQEFHHPNGGKSKFLEDPMNSEHTAIAAAMAVPLKKVFR